MKFITTDQWHATFSGGYVGTIFFENMDNGMRETGLDEKKQDLETRLRSEYAEFSRPDFMQHPVLKAYRDYYKKFKKTYHVQLQLESIVLKGKSLPQVSPLVDANFTAEMETFVLTAGHDADRLGPTLTIDAANGGEPFTGMNGKRQSLKPGDMMMTDGGRVVCTILYGQDDLTPIAPATRNVLYVAYAPPGVPERAVNDQMDALETNIGLVSSRAVPGRRRVFAA